MAAGYARCGQRCVLAICLALVCVSSALAQPPAPTTEIWYRYGLASVMTGRLANGTPVGENLYVVALGPANGVAPRIERHIRDENARLVPALVARFTQALDHSIRSLPEAVDALDPQDETQHILSGVSSREVAASVQRAFVTLETGYRDALGRLLLQLGEDPKRYRVGIVRRYCDGTTATDCALSTFAVESNRSTARFGKLWEWLAPAMTTVGLNAPIVVADGVPQPLGVPVALPPGERWAPLPDGRTRIAQLEHAVDRARSVQARLEYVVPSLVGLGQSSGLRIADALSSAPEALVRLPRSTELVFTRLSDTIARARIADCAQLRGQTSLTAVLECAGYTGPPAIAADCLGGKRCLPEFGQKTLVDVLAITKGVSSRELLALSPNARVALGSIDEVDRLAKTCAQSNPESPAAAALCLVKARSASARASIECAEKARGDARALAACVPVGTLPANVQAQVTCARDRMGDPVGLALCAGVGTLPKGAKELVSCASDRQHGGDRSKIAQCMAKAAGADPAVTKATQCLSEHPNDWKAAALCATPAAQLPKEVQSAVTCARENTTAAAVGACMVGANVSGDVGKAAQCYASSAGSPAGMAVCMAGDGLTMDQRIALQCAAQSGGEPSSWAVCTAGQLAWKEFNNCRGKRAFEDACFGKGNDLRRFVESLGIEVGPKSVAADVITLQIRVVDAFVKGGEDVLKAGGKAVEDLAKGIKGATERTGAALRNPEQAVRNCLRTPFRCVQ